MSYGLDPALMSVIRAYMMYTVGLVIAVMIYTRFKEVIERREEARKLYSVLY